MVDTNGVLGMVRYAATRSRSKYVVGREGWKVWLLLYAFRDLWKEWGGVTQICRSFHRTASSTTGRWSCWNILMCFLYIILSTKVSFF